MRGKIIQYNGADGSGTVVADGKQYRFALASWRGDSAPAINKTVEFSLDGETVNAVTLVSDDVLLKEKAAEWSGKLGAAFKNIPTGSSASGGAAPAGAGAPTGFAPAAGGAAVLGTVIDRYGKAIPIAYILFLLGTLAFNAVSVSMMGSGFGKSFFDVANLFSQMGTDGGGLIKLLLIVAYISIGVPMFWHTRRAWLALLIPLIAVLWAIFSVLHTLDSFGGGSGISDFYSLSFGFWLTLLSALALAGLGGKRFLTGP